MPQPAARMNDRVTGTDVHVVLVPVGLGTVPTPLPHPYLGRVAGGCSADVLINGRQAALQGSSTQLDSPHIPQGGAFQRPPSGAGTVQTGSPTVLVNGRPLARLGDVVVTCNDPMDAPTSAIAGGSEDVMVS